VSKRILETDPQPPRTRLCVWDAPQPAPEHAADHAKHVLRAVEPDATNEMNVVRQLGVHAVLPARVAALSADTADALTNWRACIHSR
jgi:hypothetical protein